MKEVLKMKKNALCAMLILVLFLTACGRNRPQENEYYPLYQSYETNVYFCTTTTVGEGILYSSEHEPTEPTIKDLFLYDLDYLMQLFEDVYFYINVLYRTSGVDIRALGEATRDIIENYPYSMQAFAYSLGIPFEDMLELDAHIFFGTLLDEIFYPIFAFAHAQIMNHRSFRTHSTWNRATYIPHHRFNRQAFDNITSMRFYREMETLVNALSANDPALFQFYFRLDPPVVENPEIQIVNAPVVTAEILEEGRIAYLQISSFLPEAVHVGIVNALNGGSIIDFYYKIQDYEHLIIDIRNNTGGNIEFAVRNFLLPLSLEPDKLPSMPLYILYAGSELGRYFGELQIESLRIPDYRPSHIPQSDSLLSVEQILNSGSLSYLNEDDLQLLSYGFRMYIDVARLNDLHHASHIPFGGRVWLLTSNRNYSASSMFTRLAKYTGFATLVGETIGGGYAVIIATSMQLPNTGIVVAWDANYITDVYGRTLNEFPTQPHYFNREGMDALETVLAMIAESRG